LSRILIPEPIAGAALDRLADRFDLDRDPELWRAPGQLRERARNADALIVRNLTQVDASLLAAAARLQAVGRVGAGLDNIDLDACRARSVKVVSAPGLNAVAVAEMTMLLLLTLARRLRPAMQTAADGTWDRLATMGSELQGRTLGLVGFGAIGAAVAERAHAFGMRVVAADPHVTASYRARLCELDELLEMADAVSLHVPLTAETRHLVNAGFLKRMRPGSWLVNTSRGGVVDEAALVAVLGSTHLGGAALDVREHEPPARPDPLAGRPNVVLTPHVAGLTVEAHDQVLEHVCALVAEKLSCQ
jgi:(S)-sulfolactate dehydrogenase